MATQTIVQSLAYISWALLLVLALGSFALAHLLRQVTDVTSGYAGFTASTAAVLAGLAWLTDGGLPYPDHLDIHAAPGLDGARGLALAVFAALVALSALRYYRGHRARWLGPLAILAGVAAVALGALGWASGDQMGLPLLVELLSLAAVSRWLAGRRHPRPLVPGHAAAVGTAAGADHAVPDGGAWRRAAALPGVADGQHARRPAILDLHRARGPVRLAAAHRRA